MEYIQPPKWTSGFPEALQSLRDNRVRKVYLLDVFQEKLRKEILHG